MIRNYKYKLYEINQLEIIAELTVLLYLAACAGRVEDFALFHEDAHVCQVEASLAEIESDQKAGGLIHLWCQLRVPRKVSG